MRTDTRINRKQVTCPNASHLGFDKVNAQFGDIVLFNENDKSCVGLLAKYPTSKERKTKCPLWKSKSHKTNHGGQ